MVLVGCLPVAVAPIVAVFVAAMVPGAVAYRAGWRPGLTVGTIGGFAALAVIGGTAVVDAAPGLGALAPTDRALARDWAANHGVTLIEASMLAATVGGNAATVLVRHLLEHADRNDVAVTARPRDERVARGYRRLGFAAVPGGTGRLMLRPARPRQAA